MKVPTSCGVQSGVNGVSGVDCSGNGTGRYKIVYKSDTNGSLIKLRFFGLENYLLTSPVSFVLKTYTVDSYAISSSVSFIISYTNSILNVSV